MDLIERQEALASLCEDCKRKYHGECPHPASKCIEYRAISKIPAVESEHKHGRWIEDKEALDAAEKLKEYCTGRNCLGCMFNTGYAECTLYEDEPCDWDLTVTDEDIT